MNSTPGGFPATFWTANVTELFERGAYYAMASFVVLYLGRLGLGNYWPSTLNGLLWTLVYFLPILSGTIADQVGFKSPCWWPSCCWRSATSSWAPRSGSAATCWRRRPAAP